MSAAWEMVKAGVVRSKRDPVTGGVDFYGPTGKVSVKRGLRGGRAGAIGDSVTAVGAGSWFHQLCLASGGRVKRSINAGIHGQNTQAMADRIVADLPKSAKLDLGFVMGGTNDLVLTDATTVKNLIGMCKYLQSIGTDTVLTLMPPRSDLTLNRDKIISKRAAVTLAAKNYGQILIDPWRNFVAPDGGWVVGASSDGIHPSVAVARVAALDAWSQLAPHVSEGWDGLHALTGIPGAIITTNDFLYDANTDGAPDGWGGYPTGGLVVTKTTLAGELGNKWRIETAGLNASAVPVAGERVEERTITGLTLAAGSRLAIAAKVSFSGYDSGLRCHVRFSPLGGGSAFALEPTYTSGDLTDAIVWAETVVPAGGSISITIQFRLVTTRTVTPSTGYVEMSQLQVWDLTTMGLA